MEQLAAELRQLGESANALRELHQVVQQCPCHAGALLSLADLLKDEGKRLLRAIQHAQMSTKGKTAVMEGGAGRGAPLRGKIQTPEQGPRKPLLAADASQRAPWSLEIRVERAKSLPGADVDGSSDPFVCLHLGKKGSGKSSMRKTSVKTKTLNPEWNESFVFPLEEAQRSEKLVVVCKDHDVSGDDMLGKAEIDLGALRCEEEHAGWHVLRGKGGSAGASRVYLVYTLRAGAQASVKHYQVASRWASDMLAEAEQLYRRCLRMEASSEVSAARLGLAELLCGQLNKPLRAKKLIEDLAAQQGGGTRAGGVGEEMCVPSDKTALLCNLACLYEQAGDVDGALDLLAQGLSVSRGRDMACLYNLARVNQYRLSKPQVARSLYAQALELAADGGGLEHSEDRDEIAERAREQMRLLDSHSSAHQRVGCLLSAAPVAFAARSWGAHCRAADAASECSALAAMLCSTLMKVDGWLGLAGVGGEDGRGSSEATGRQGRRPPARSVRA